MEHVFVIDSHEDPSHMMICLKHSKTNPFGAGFTLHFDRTGDEKHLAITTSPFFIYQRVR